MAGARISFDNAADQSLAAVLDRPRGAVSGRAPSPAGAGLHVIEPARQLDVLVG